MHAPHFDWLIPDWPTPPQIRAVCTTRNGGVSTGNYASLNLGLHVGDGAQAVAENRQRVQVALGVRPVWMHQVHGCEVLQISLHTQDALAADCAMSVDTNTACTVMVADCLPVLFCDAQGSRVAAAHAGWRGLLGVQGRGVLEATMAACFGDTSGVAARGVLAWLGPCIGPQAFEVGDEVRAAFVAHSPEAAVCFQALSGGKWLADLAGLARQRLAAMGITRVFGNDSTVDWCTVSNPSRFFSHRRDGVSGRMAACIWRVG
jgi:YfiH family protein